MNGHRAIADPTRIRSDRKERWWVRSSLLDPYSKERTPGSQGGPASGVGTTISLSRTPGVGRRTGPEGKIPRGTSPH